ncbi:hypothetical protein [Bosea sp. Tri-54]|nr:hypothetical protein [Bosea sp. Tri-54]
MPGDFTGFDIIRIVAKTRCELRDSVRGFIVGSLSRKERVDEYPRYAELAQNLIDGKLSWRDLNTHLKTYRVDPKTLAVLERYNHAVVVYDFQFDMSEVNEIGLTVDALRNFSNGAASLGGNAGSKLVRDNFIQFRLSDVFENLVRYTHDGYCRDGGFTRTTLAEQKNPKLIYPITGSLGLDEIVGTFLNLNQSANLVGPADVPAESRFPTTLRRMEFTTQLSGGATASLAIAPRPYGGRITKTGFSNSNSRNDIHKLTVVLKLPPEAPVVPATIAELRLSGDIPRAAPGERITDIVTTLALKDLRRSQDNELAEATIRARRAQAERLTD